MKKWIPKQSVKTRLIITMMALLTILILACWFMNKAFLPSYYQYSKASMLSASFDRMNQIVDEDKTFIDGDAELSDDSKLSLEMLGANSSMSIYMCRVGYFFDTAYCQFEYSSSGDQGTMQMQSVKSRIVSYVMDLSNPTDTAHGKEAIKKTDTYSIYKVFDERIGSYYIELFGKLDSGSYAYIRANYQSMNENVRISNRFLGYIGIVVILLGFGMMYVLGNSFAKPIRKMTDIAQRMAELDFEAKYPVTTQDEVGMLGSSLNGLSEQLEETISELKSANNELQKDIEHKIQIDEMRKDFLSNVSHELKTPIALIQGYAEGLYDNINDDSESREFYCEVIMDEANKMNKMVKKLLTLNQIEFGKNQVSFERFDVVQVIQSVIQSAHLLADQKGADIIMEEYAPTYVWADEYFVEEVVTNYVSNAINHVDGEKNIIVRMEEREKVVRVSVFNTGKCIPEDELDKIWIKFYKVDKARTRAYGGSGIGLSIVKAIVESMHQKCGVINHEDGVEFWFELDRKS